MIEETTLNALRLNVGLGMIVRSEMKQWITHQIDCYVSKKPMHWIVFLERSGRIEHLRTDSGMIRRFSNEFDARAAVNKLNGKTTSNYRISEPCKVEGDNNGISSE